MRKIRDVLRLRLGADLSLDEIARALKVSKGVVAKYLTLAKAADIGWPIRADLDDADLERLLFPRRIKAGPTYIEPDHAQVHQELKRKGVTLQLLWEEYRQSAGDRAYQYTAFCNHCLSWTNVDKWYKLSGMLSMYLTAFVILHLLTVAMICCDKHITASSAYRQPMRRRVSGETATRAATMATQISSMRRPEDGGDPASARGRGGVADRAVTTTA